MYKVKSFVIYNGADGYSIVQSQSGIVRIEDKNMIDFLNFLDCHSTISNISKKNILEFFSHFGDEAITFLEDNYIIQENDGYNFNVNKVVMFSNDKSISKLFDQETESFNQSNFQHLKDIKNISLDSQTLLVTFINPLDWQLVDTIHKLVKKYDSLWLLSYPYNNNFYFNNLYRYSWHVPCYKCVKSEIEDQERIEMFDEMSYQQVVDKLYNSNPGFEIATKIDFSMSVKIIAMIHFILEQFIFIDDPIRLQRNDKVANILDCFKLDTLNNTVMHESAIHWEMCDCYE